MQNNADANNQPLQAQNYLQDGQTVYDFSDSSLVYDGYILIKISSGKSSAFPVTPLSTVADIKEQVWVTEGIPSHKQRLIYMRDSLLNCTSTAEGTELKDDNALCRLEVPLGGLVVVEVVFSIFIKTINGKNGNLFSLNVCPTDDMRSKIYPYLSGSRSNLVLLLQGQHMRDGLTLPQQLLGLTVSENGIHAGCTVLVGVPINILIVKPNQERKPFRVYTSDTVLDIKRRICFRTGIPDTSQLLFYHDEILEDHLAFVDLDIKPGSSIMIRKKLRKH